MRSYCTVKSSCCWFTNMGTVDSTALTVLLDLVAESTDSVEACANFQSLHARSTHHMERKKANETTFNLPMGNANKLDLVLVWFHGTI